MKRDEAWEIVSRFAMSGAPGDGIGTLVLVLDGLIKETEEETEKASVAATPPAKPEPANPKLVKRVAAKPTPSLDDGKIKALRNAGWSLAKIGDEMGVSGTTILNHLNAMDKKEENKNEDDNNG